MELTRKEVRKLRATECLGVGGYAIAEKANFRGEEVVMKTLIEAQSKEALLQEAQVLRELEGAGGAPLLRAFCTDPPVLITSYSGESYESYLQEVATDREVVESFVAVAQRIAEVHRKNMLHNDLKYDNLTVSFSDEGDVVFHLIDFGLSTIIGDLNVLKPRLGLIWVPPEIRHCQQPPSPASDVYSFGILVRRSMKYVVADDTYERLVDIEELATAEDPQERPDLQVLISKLQEALLYTE